MGSYTVSVTDHSGCVAAVSFSIADASTLVVDIGDDTTICVGNKVRLHTWIPGASYQWSTGSTDSFVVVTAPATNPLIVRVTKGNCTVADTVMVYTDSIIGFDLTASKMTICPTMPDTVSLTAMGKSNTPTAVAVFTWSTGFSDSAANTSAVQVHHSGSYTVTVEDDICTVTKSLTIADGPCDTACIGDYKTPNAFTPNGDTKNELFRVRYKCSLYNFSMRIYNRWGELIFETTDPNSGWDGTYKGIAQPEEVYMWNCCVAGTAGAGVKCTTGTLSLFR